MTRAPDSVRRHTAELLRDAGVNPDRGRSLLVRVDRFWEDLVQPLERQAVRLDHVVHGHTLKEPSPVRWSC